MNKRLINLVGVVLIFPEPTLAYSGWEPGKILNGFAIRCANGPIALSSGALKSTIYEYIYLKWDENTFTRHTYTVSNLNPAIFSEEVPEIYNAQNATDSRKMGSDNVNLKIETKENGWVSIILLVERAHNISEVNILMGNANYSNGTWAITKTNEGVSLNEATATIFEGKVHSSESTSWKRCNLMSADHGEFNIEPVKGRTSPSPKQ